MGLLENQKPEAPAPFPVSVEKHFCRIFGMRRKILFEGRRTRNAWLQQWRRHGASLSPHIPSWTPRFSDCMRRLYAKLGERAFSFAGSSSAGNAPSENLCAITDPAEFRKQLTPPTHTLFVKLLF